MRHPPAVLISLAAILICSALRAQDLEPRSYSNSPIGLNFLIVGYGYATGSVLVDPALPLDNVSNEINFGLLAYARTLNVFGQSGKINVVVPFGSLFAEGIAFGQPRERFVTGFFDPGFRFSMNFIGAPALSAAEFKNYRQDVIVGGSVRVVVPLGQYDDTRLVNISSNRWSVKTEVGASKAIGKWTMEIAPAITFYTENDDFFGGKTRAQEPVYSVQTNVSYTIKPGCWLALNGTYFVGARSTIDGVKSDDEQAGPRLGATFSLPVTRNHSVKFYGITGFDADLQHDFDAVGIAWQYRWGAGF